ncbi:hypothetical protein [Croceicoccus gelatinilyticus]|uniref:hypothetical protein n=1 Tax=Croceicoccus gelatinilyticus TaxID=2835536 RepID=UPI001BCB2B5A|nr:hypothetical protein [Croceicoccus gelatinilyticus]MBS7669348.1 hypothetical protein [Croceicoccus gelatinilyticus]
MVVVLRSEVVQAREGIVPMRRPWDRTGAVDVEVLCAWAYGAQMVDRYERVGLSVMEAEAAGYEVSRYSNDGVGQLMQIEHLGCRIDRGGVTLSADVHPAALAVAHAVNEAEGGRMVRAYALAGTRPSAWVEPEHKARASVWVKPWEKAQVEYQGPGRKGAYCPVIVLWDEGRKEWGRKQYRQWHEALVEVAWLLSTRALGFTVTGPVASAEPWLDVDTARAA